MNEVQVDLDEDGRIHLSRAGHSANGIYTLETTEALRAFFQAERDEALGRWRDPENPDWICYGRGSSRDTVYVINEYDGLPYMLERDQVAYADSEFSAVAQRYFETHPKPKSCPPFAAYVDKNGSAVWVTDENSNLRCLSDQNLDPEKYAPFTRLLPNE